MPKQPDNWPAGCLPRMLDVRQASYYVGISPVTFLDRVKKGRYPQGMKEGARVLWDRHGLDALLNLRSGIKRESIPDTLTYMDLRRSGLTELGNAGATDDEIRSVSGHLTREVVKAYVLPNDEQAAHTLEKRRKGRTQRG